MMKMLPKPANCEVTGAFVSVAEQDVLVFFLHQFVARGNNHFDHVLAGRQHGLAVGTSSADRAVRAGARTGRTVDADSAPVGVTGTSVDGTRMTLGNLYMPS